MTADKNESPRDRLRISAALTGACAALVLGTAHAETRIEPRIGFDATWTDNAQLVADGARKNDELIGQLRPGITLIHETRNFQAFLDYQLQAMYFQDEGESQVFHQGDLGIQYAVVPDWFYLDLGANRSQVVVDPRQPINVGNMFTTGNLADSTSGQISPIVRHTFRLFELDASYTRGFLNYSRADTIDQTTPRSPTTFDDSQNESAHLSLRSPDPESGVTWDTTYQHDRVEYDISEPFEYDQAYLELGFRVGRGFRLLAQGGLETDPLRHRSSGGLDETSYKGGFEWREGERNLVRALVGHRFFGRSYEGLWRYTGRVLEGEVSYNESPTTQAQDRVVRGITAPGDFPPGLDQQLSRTTSDVYLSKALNGRIGLRGRLTGIFLSGDWEKRQYIYLGGLEDEYKGVNLLVTRRLGPRVTLEATAGYTDANLREGDSYTDKLYSISLQRQIGNKTVLTLTGNRINRTGTVQAYTANSVILGIEVNFAGTQETGGGRGFKGGGRPATRATTLPTIPQR